MLVTHLPADAAVWRVLRGEDSLTRPELLLAALERRVTVLWATVSAALGHPVPDEHLAGPLDTAPPSPSAPERGEPQVRSMREIAAWMRT